MRNNDTRCCGTGTCMINAEGMCWCGQRWDGEKMCPPSLHDEQACPTPASGERQQKRAANEDDGFADGPAE